MLSKKFATLLAHFFNRHGYHTYWQVYTVDVAVSLGILSEVFGRKPETD
jgi:hypothetical protein